jgi:hypothetical protein
MQHRVRKGQSCLCSSSSSSSHSVASAIVYCRWVLPRETGYLCRHLRVCRQCITGKVIQLHQKMCTTSSWVSRELHDTHKSSAAACDSLLIRAGSVAHRMHQHCCRMQYSCCLNHCPLTTLLHGTTVWTVTSACLPTPFQTTTAKSTWFLPIFQTLSAAAAALEMHCA